MQSDGEDIEFVERREEDRRKDSRRRYNRRQGDAPVAPPYFVVFERIAVALERIAQSVGGQAMVLPSQHEDDDR